MSVAAAADALGIIVINDEDEAEMVSTLLEQVRAARAAAPRVIVDIFVQLSAPKSLTGVNLRRTFEHEKPVVKHGPEVFPPKRPRRVPKVTP